MTNKTMVKTAAVPLFICECLRCGHKWHPRKNQLPKKCAKCGSQYWNSPRQIRKAKCSDTNDE